MQIRNLYIYICIYLLLNIIIILLSLSKQDSNNHRDDHVEEEESKQNQLLHLLRPYLQHHTTRSYKPSAYYESRYPRVKIKPNIKKTKHCEKQQKQQTQQTEQLTQPTTKLTTTSTTEANQKNATEHDNVPNFIKMLQLGKNILPDDQGLLQAVVPLFNLQKSQTNKTFPASEKCKTQDNLLDDEKMKQGLSGKIFEGEGKNKGWAEDLKKLNNNQIKELIHYLENLKELKESTDEELETTTDYMTTDNEIPNTTDISAPSCHRKAVDEMTTNIDDIELTTGNYLSQFYLA